MTPHAPIKRPLCVSPDDPHVVNVLFIRPRPFFAQYHAEHIPHQFAIAIANEEEAGKQFVLISHRCSSHPPFSLARHHIQKSRQIPNR